MPEPVTSILAPSPDTAPTTRAPTGKLPELEQALAEAPSDHAARLDLAREQLSLNKRTDSYDAYEALITAGERLPQVIEDLMEVTSIEGPIDARVNRLLGDALMADGRIQEAIDAYRGALDKI